MRIPVAWGQDGRSCCAAATAWSGSNIESIIRWRAPRAAVMPCCQTRVARRASRPVRASFGTNGKSTVTDLAGALLRGAGLGVEVCGNIGRPACGSPPPVGADGVVIAGCRRSSSDRGPARAAGGVCRPRAGSPRSSRRSRHHGANRQHLFRRRGAATWRSGTPMIRVMKRRIPAGTRGSGLGVLLHRDTGRGRRLRRRPHADAGTARPRRALDGRQ
jgi:hypothetical protein